MIFTELEISGLFLIEPKVIGDGRGYFLESYRDDLFSRNIRSIQFVQDNESRSTSGVLRGLHYQLPPFAQSKLVRVIEGAVLDVAVDIRSGSATFGRYVAVELSAENKKQLFIPRGFAHGFVVLSEAAIFSYKVDNYYSREDDRGIRWNDPSLGIDWRLSERDLILSEKDRNAPLISEAELFPEGQLYE